MYDTPLHRLLKIICLVQAETGWNAQRLAAHLGVTQKTIHRDRERLLEVGVPIAYDRATKGYVIDGTFFLDPPQLAPEEAFALATMCLEIAGKEQIAFLHPARDALAKIRATLPEPQRRELDRIGKRIIMRTGPASPPDGYADVFLRVREAIAQGRVLECRYESPRRREEAERGGAGEESDEFLFKPYALLYSVRAWYALGWHSGRDDLRCLKLKRFSKMRLTEARYEIPADFSLEAHLGNAWSMIRGEDVEVEILVDPEFAETLGDTQWHVTQEIEEHEDGSATFRCTVAGLDEIVWWVLSMGPHCRVVRPPQLAARVRELARRMAAVYEAEE